MNVDEEFQNEIRRANSNLMGYKIYENITMFYDEFFAPILDITDNGDSLTYYFRESSNTYTFEKVLENEGATSYA